MALNKREFLAGAAVVVGSAAAVTEVAADDQPHMSKAVEYLQSAKTELEKSSHDKGGHRVKAINLVDQAIREVRAGKQAARS